MKQCPEMPAIAHISELEAGGGDPAGELRPLLVRLPRRAPDQGRPPAPPRVHRHMKAKITKYDEELVAKSRALPPGGGSAAPSPPRCSIATASPPRSAPAGTSSSATRRSPSRGSAPARRGTSSPPRPSGGRRRRASGTPTRCAGTSAPAFGDAEAAAGWTGGGARRRLAGLAQAHAGHAAGAAARRPGRVAAGDAGAPRGAAGRTSSARRGERPEGAPPPKDTTLVELRGWYERWHLLAQRVFRGREDLLAPFGLTSGKAPPRLRGKAAQIKYGERAASLTGSALRPRGDRRGARAGGACPVFHPFQARSDPMPTGTARGAPRRPSHPAIAHRAVTPHAPPPVNSC